MHPRPCNKGLRLKSLVQHGKTTHTRGLLGQIWKGGQGKAEKDQTVKLGDWSTAQQQVLTSETLGFTVARMGLPEAPESGLRSSPGDLKGEDPFLDQQKPGLRSK